VTSRRKFLSAAAGAGVSASLLAASSLDAPLGSSDSPNDKIQIALIGCGGQGQADARASTASGLTKLVAAADCYDGRLAHMREVYGQDTFVTKNYQEILARKDIDAVIIGAPDHWHRQIMVDALHAKKDVYCEKPMVQHVDDGLPVVEAQKQTGRILQIGSQRVSSVIYKKAQELFRAGAVGKLNMVEAWWDRNSSTGAWQYAIPTDADTATCDWKQFQGRAPKTEWDPKRFFRWRCYRDYGTGVGGDLFVHLFSGLHFITGAIGPTRVYATGGIRYWNDGRDVPDLFFGFYDYPETTAHPAFNLVLRVNFESGAKENSGFRFTGSEGIMTVGDNVTVTSAAPETQPGYTIDTFSEPEQKAFLRSYHTKYAEMRPSAASMKSGKEQTFDAPAHYNDLQDHHRNFALAVRSRKPVVEDAVFGFRAAGPALVSNMSYFEKRVVEWNPATMQVKA
jgi:predicted dehydrogenase